MKKKAPAKRNQQDSHNKDQATGSLNDWMNKTLVDDHVARRRRRQAHPPCLCARIEDVGLPHFGSFPYKLGTWSKGVGVRRAVLPLLTFMLEGRSRLVCLILLSNRRGFCRCAAWTVLVDGNDDTSLLSQPCFHGGSFHRQAGCQRDFFVRTYSTEEYNTPWDLEMMSLWLFKSLVAPSQLGSYCLSV